MREAGRPVSCCSTNQPRGVAMRASDVMTSEVISVDENATVTAVARLLAERGISAVPVVDKGNRVIGMVSEGDLLHRAETGTERRRSWWLDMMASTNKLAGDYIRSRSGKVKDVMTRDVISVTRDDAGRAPRGNLKTILTSSPRAISRAQRRTSTDSSTRRLAAVASSGTIRPKKP